MSCRRSSRFWGLGCPKIFHEIEDSLGFLLWCLGQLLQVGLLVQVAVHGLHPGDVEQALHAVDEGVARYLVQYRLQPLQLVRRQQAVGFEIDQYDLLVAEQLPDPVVEDVFLVRCPPWRAKRRRVVPGSREATRDTRRAEGAKGDPKGASERGVQSYGRPVCSRNELAMLWRNAG